MKSILNIEVKKDILNRLNNLTIDNKPLWGKMNASEMICHVSDQIRMAVGIKKTKFIGNIFLKTFAKWMVLAGMPAPKGKIETLKELKQGVGGTVPGDFEEDRKKLIQLINEFEKLYPAGVKIRHAAFGDMNFKQWGKLTYSHLNHHLSQFGV